MTFQLREITRVTADVKAATGSNLDKLRQLDQYMNRAKPKLNLLPDLKILDSAKRTRDAIKQSNDYMKAFDKAQKKTLENFEKNIKRQLPDLKEIKKTNTQVKKIQQVVDKVIEPNKKNISKLGEVFKKLPFLNALSKSMNNKVPSKFGAVTAAIAGAAAAGVVALLVKTQEEIQEINIRSGEVKDASIDKALDRTFRNSARIKTIEKQIEQVKTKTDKNLSDQAKELYTVKDRTLKQEKFNNDITYEVRQGRKIVEAQAAAADKKANDALYEVRQGRQILETKIDQARKPGNDALYEVRQGRQILESRIGATVGAIGSLRTEVNSRINQVASEVRNNLSRPQPEPNLQPLQQQIQQVSKRVELGFAEVDRKLKIGLQPMLTQAEYEKQQAQIRAQSQEVTQLKKDLRYGGSWRWETQFADVQKGVTQFVIERTQKVDQDFNRLQAAIAANARTGEGLLTAINRLDRENAERTKQITQQIQQQVTQTVTKVINNGVPVEQIAQLQGEISTLKRETTQIKNTIPKIETQIKEQEKMNQEGLKKLDNIAAIAALIPARAGIEAANRINPKIPTQAQISSAAAAGVCTTTKPGGCMNKALDDNAKDIKNNANQNSNNLLDAIQTVGQGVDLSMLNTINNKLGDQIPGGLTGGFSRLYRLLQIDRVLNILTYINTLHNAFMLSNNIGQTLFSAFDNIAEFAGFKWKNEKDEEVSFSEIVGDFTENFFKSLFGEDNYNAMVTTYKKANRIYQAGANILNSARSMIDSVRNIGEFTAENTGRIGNALRKFGVVGENAYKAMPEQVNAQSIWVQRLNNLEEAASGIEMVTSELASITQNVNEIREQKEEFEKSITDSPTKEQAENTAVKAVAVASKAASPGQDLSEEDKESDE